MLIQNIWSEWLDGIPSEQHGALVEALASRGAIKPQTSDHREDIPIICTAPEDLLVAQSVPYLDVYNLFPEYQKFAFQDHGNLLIKGPKGNGKSLSIRAFAAHHTVPLVVVECSENTKDLQLIGRYVMVGRETRFILTGLPKAIHIANQVGRCVLILEEFNALTPQSQKLLNGVLQERAVEVDALGRTYRLEGGAAVWFTGTMNPCFHPDTDVLTPNGVRKVVDLKAGDKVYSFNRETGRQDIDEVVTVWAHPADRMMLIENQHTKLRVTPEHRLVVKGRSASKWDLKTAEEMALWMEGKGPTNADILYPKPFDLPEMNKLHVDVMQLGEYMKYELGHNHWLPFTNTKNTCRLDYPMDDFLSLLGWYISEGSSYLGQDGSHLVHIAQEKHPWVGVIQALLEKMEINFHLCHKKGDSGESRISGFSFADKVLYHALRHFGGAGSENKMIHSYIRGLSKSNLIHLFEAMYAGDGDTPSERLNSAWALERGTPVFRSKRYSTKSQQLYLDTLWLANYLGYTTTRHKEAADGVYRIGLRPARPHTTHLEYEEIPWDGGWVVNVEVKHNRTICAGEDGKFLYVSNSVYGGTYDLNEDLKSRVSEIEIDYPPTELEKQVVRANLGAMDSAMESIVDLMLRFAKESRQNAMGYALSIRDVVRSLQTVRTNGLKTALQMVICKYEGEDRKTALARLNSIFKGVTLSSSWDGKQ